MDLEQKYQDLSDQVSNLGIPTSSTSNYRKFSFGKFSFGKFIKFPYVVFPVSLALVALLLITIRPKFIMIPVPNSTKRKYNFKKLCLYTLLFSVLSTGVIVFGFKKMSNR